MRLGLAQPTKWAFLVLLVSCETWAVEVDVCQNDNESRPSKKPRNKIKIEISWEEGEKPYAFLKSGKIENWTRNDTPIFISIRHPEYFHEEEINLNITLESCPETLSRQYLPNSSNLSNTTTTSTTTTTTTRTTTTLPPPTTTSDNLSNTDRIAIIAVTSSGALALLVTVVVLVLCKRCNRKPSPQREESELHGRYCMSLCQYGCQFEPQRCWGGQFGLSVGNRRQSQLWLYRG